MHTSGLTSPSTSPQHVGLQESFIALGQVNGIYLHSEALLSIRKPLGHYCDIVGEAATFISISQKESSSKDTVCILGCLMHIL